LVSELELVVLSNLMSVPRLRLRNVLDESLKVAALSFVLEAV
jgi:hypothetical protein